MYDLLYYENKLRDIENKIKKGEITQDLILKQKFYRFRKNQIIKKRRVKNEI